MVLLTKVLLFCIIWTGTVRAYKDYKNYRIYQTLADNDAKQDILYKLSQDGAYSFFSLNRRANRPQNVLVSPEKFNEFSKVLTENQIYFKVLSNDVSQILVEERKANSERKRMTDLEVFDAFYSLDEIYEYLDNLANKYSDRLYVKTFGRTFEKRPMKMLIINNGDGVLDKKIIFVDAAIHSREWISTSMALFLIQQLVENLQETEELLKDFNWVIMPVVNADGYVFSHEEDRYWRKTRKANAGTDCVGTDLNRNFGYYWGLDEGSSDDPCLEIYRGAEAFSEQEARVLKDIFEHYNDKLVYYLSLHSYGNMILLPWGYTSQIPDTFFDMMDVADAGAMAIARETGGVYDYGNSYDVIYATSGDSVDYIVGIHNTSVAMTMELPAGGAWGFDPPVREIKQHVEESWVGIRAMAEAVVNKF